MTQCNLSVNTLSENDHKLPPSIQPLFHNYHTDSIDVRRHKKLVILTVLTGGTWEQDQWVARTYGLKAIEEVVREDLDGCQTLPRPVANYWSVVLWGQLLPPQTFKERWGMTRKLPKEED